MLLRKAIQKTKIFFHKTLQNLKSFIFGEYQKLPKAHHPLNPLYCSNSNTNPHPPNMQQLDQFYRDFSEQWESDNDKAIMKRKRMKKTIMSAKEPMKEKDTCIEEQGALKNKHEESEKEEKKIEPCPQVANGGGYMLAERMRELELMDMNDADHVLDIEEVLHYYSRLTCPVYVDIVDKFFMDMSSEFFRPQTSVRISNSSWRLGPLMF